MQLATLSRPIYTPVKERPMQVVVFGSGMGTNLEALLAADQHSFEIKALFTDRLCRIQQIGAFTEYPVIYHSFADFFKRKGIAKYKDVQTRMEYDAENVRLLQACAEEYCFSIDLIFLAGYMRVLYAPLLGAFKDKIINVHPADLTETTPDGKRRYIGENAVYDALRDGKAKTRSSVILVDENIDGGPLLVSGPWVTYEGGCPVTKESAKEHQMKQKRLSDWPASIEAITLISEGLL